MQPQFRKTLEVLAAYDVRFVVIGGVAMGLHGSAYVTVDIDVVYARDEDNLQALASALAPHDPSLRGAPADLPFRWDARTLKMGMNFTLDSRLGPIDLLGSAAGAPDFGRLWSEARVVNLGDIKVRIASLDDLILMKQAAGRPKDKGHLLELQALKKLQE